MKVDLRYFASLREALGCDGEHVELPASVETAGALRRHLRDRGEPWADAFAEHRTLRVAIDQAMASADTRLHDGAEVAFFPPVTGG